MKTRGKEEASNREREEERIVEEKEKCVRRRRKAFIENESPRVKGEKEEGRQEMLLGDKERKLFFGQRVLNAPSTQEMELHNKIRTNAMESIFYRALGAHV
ncbi:hypothetical protein KP509_1Z220600 [Ceratopteris richardii]|nr:hypothetical protein KP509_1Z220600 [Ceratopteris richardii]